MGLLNDAMEWLNQQSVHEMPLEEANRILSVRNRDEISRFLSKRGKQNLVQLKFFVEDRGALGFVDAVLLPRLHASL